MRKLLSLALLVSLAVSSTCIAEPSKRIFLRYEGTGAELEIFNSAIHRFQKEVFAVEKHLEFVNRDDASQVYTQCAGMRVETDPMRVRGCWFEVVERLGVEHFLEVRLVVKEENQYEFKLEIWNPSTRGLIYTSYVDLQAPSLRKAFADGLPKLAQDYLCHRGHDELCAPIVGADGKPIVEKPSETNWLAWGLIGGGAVMLVAIIPVALVNRGNAEQLDAMADNHPDRPSFEDAITRNEVAMQVLGALGAITFGVGLTFLLLDVGISTDDDGGTADLQLSPSLSPNNLGLQLRVRF